MAVDALGREVQVGDWVVAPYSKSMTQIAQVVKVCPKQLELKPLTPYRDRWGHVINGGTFHRLASECVILPTKEAEAHALCELLRR